MYFFVIIIIIYKEISIYKKSDGVIVKALSCLDADLDYLIKSGYDYIEGIHNPNRFKVVDGKAVEIEKTEDEIAGITKTLRNAKLSASDWTQLSDASLSDDKKAEWKTYRQALRDLPTHAKWPNLESGDWPTPPS